jgi:hypothetical protein
MESTESMLPNTLWHKRWNQAARDARPWSGEEDREVWRSGLSDLRKGGSENA